MVFKVVMVITVVMVNRVAIVIMVAMVNDHWSSWSPSPCLSSDQWSLTMVIEVVGFDVERIHLPRKITQSWWTLVANVFLNVIHTSSSIQTHIFARVDY